MQVAANIVTSRLWHLRVVKVQGRFLRAGRKEAGKRTVDRVAGIDPQCRMGLAQRGVAADVIQVPVRVDDRDDRRPLGAGQRLDCSVVPGVTARIDDDQAVRGREDDGVTVGLAVRQDPAGHQPYAWCDYLGLRRSDSPGVRPCRRGHRECREHGAGAGERWHERLLRCPGRITRRSVAAITGRCAKAASNKSRCVATAGLSIYPD